LLAIGCGPALAAIDDIPTTSGFSGFVLAGFGLFGVETNLIEGGPPLLSDVGHTRVSSLLEAPGTANSLALPLAGEINHTFAKTRTQLFFGNRLEDLLRLDVVFGLGVRKRLPDESIAALSGLITPIPTRVWSDPYIEGEDRVGTDRVAPGARLRWGRILHTGLELTATYRDFQHDDIRDGQWLVDQGRLDPAETTLLSREGVYWIFQALYRLTASQRHQFEPAIRYRDARVDGAAVRMDGLVAQLTYLYLTRKLVVDVVLAYGREEADAVHPVYGKTLKSNFGGAAVTVFYDLFKARRWRAFVSADVYREDPNVDFFNGGGRTIQLGVVWRHGRK
jgi:hypothetical protein